ncbi:MAG: hypothetical protein ACK5FS_05390 [Planctomycetota bacterium]|jgi:hypothetical protein
MGIVTTEIPFEMPKHVLRAGRLHPAKLSISNESLYARATQQAMCMRLAFGHIAINPKSVTL